MAALAQVATYAQFGGIAAVLMGEHLWSMLHRPMPEFWRQSVEPNKVPLGMGIWLFGGTMVQNLVKTGAFEVYFDGELVFSKLQTHTMPSGELLYERIYDIIQRKKLRIGVRPMANLVGNRQQ
mmetsp:Transcript_9684/g.27170  ORF Transcript_9684/g.27170 Transcript_9684/m.27170 type:complete len:123 (-) Transcript_9684:1028-1396(-)